MTSLWIHFWHIFRVSFFNSLCRLQGWRWAQKALAQSCPESALPGALAVLRGLLSVCVRTLQKLVFGETFFGKETCLRSLTWRLERCQCPRRSASPFPLAPAPVFSSAFRVFLPWRLWLMLTFSFTPCVFQVLEVPKPELFSLGGGWGGRPGKPRLCSEEVVSVLTASGSSRSQRRDNWVVREDGSSRRQLLSSGGRKRSLPTSKSIWKSLEC